MTNYFKFIHITLVLIFYTITLAAEKPDRFNVLLIASSKIKGDQNLSDKDFAEIISTNLSRPSFGVLLPDSLSQTAFRNYNSGIWNELRLAREININAQETLNIDAILFATLENMTEKSVALPKFDRQVFTYTLTSSFKLVSVDSGITFAGDSVIAEKRISQTSGVQLNLSYNSIIKELSQELVDEISSSILSTKSLDNFTKIKEQNKTVPNPMVDKTSKATTNLVDILVSAELKNISVPEIIKGKNGELSLTGNKLDLKPTDAFVEINGVVVGMCSENKKLKVPAGLAKLKVSKSGFIPVEKMINAYDGLSLSVTLEPTPEEFNKWKEKIMFLREIKSGEKLDQNQQKLTEGLYDFLKNSKYKVPRIDLN